jgi:O-antigen/teichoic acid export membrane protein
MIRSATALMRRYSHINWALADQAMVSGVNFLTGILLARYLGVEEYGRFTLAWMSVLLANSIQHAMINSPMMSIGPKHSENEAPTYYGAIIFQQIVFSCLIFLVFFAGVHWSGVVFQEWKVEGLALPLASAALAFQSHDFLRRYFFTRGRVTAAFVNDAIRYLGQIAVLVWVFMSFGDTADSADALWVIAIMAAVSTVFGAFLVERVELNVAILRATTLRHWHFSKWLGASALLQWTSGNFFLIAAGTLLGSTAVGALRAAQNLMGITHILFKGMENVVPIQASRYYHENGPAKLRTYLGKLLVNGGLATLIIALTFSVVPGFWLNLFYGESYAVYDHLVRWFAVIYIFIFLGFPLRVGLRAVEHMKPIFWSYVMISVFSLAAAYPMVRWWGLTGVVSGLLSTQVITLIALWIGLRSHISLRAQ